MGLKSNLVRSALGTKIVVSNLADGLGRLEELDPEAYARVVGHWEAIVKELDAHGLAPSVLTEAAAKAS